MSKSVIVSLKHITQTTIVEPFQTDTESEECTGDESLIEEKVVLSKSDNSNSPLQRIRPNTQFLSRFVGSCERVNDKLNNQSTPELIGQIF